MNMESTALIITDPQSKEMQLLKRTTAPDLTVDEFAMFLHYCKFAGLNPFLKQVYATKRNGRVTFQTGIDAFRARADETGKYAGQLGPFWCGTDGKWLDVWLSKEPPEAAKVGVLRSDFREAIWAIAKYAEYVQMTKDENSGAYRPNAMWKKMPANQLAKCAEALAIRKAFPEKLGGLYTDDEMQQADNPPAPDPLNVTPAPGSLDQSGQDQPQTLAQPAQKPDQSRPTPAPAGAAAPAKPAKNGRLSPEAELKIRDMCSEMVDAAYGTWTQKHMDLRIKKGAVVGDEVILAEVQKDYDAFKIWQRQGAQPSAPAASDDIPL